MLGLPRHPGTSLQDGFGFIPGAAEGGAASKVPQMRGISIGSDVEIGFGPAALLNAIALHRLAPAHAAPPSAARQRWVHRRPRQPPRHE